MFVRMLLNDIFGEENFRNEIIVKRGAPKAGLISQFKDLEQWQRPTIIYIGFLKEMMLDLLDFIKRHRKRKSYMVFGQIFRKVKHTIDQQCVDEILGINIK